MISLLNYTDGLKKLFDKEGGGNKRCIHILDLHYKECRYRLGRAAFLMRGLAADENNVNFK